MRITRTRSFPSRKAKDLRWIVNDVVGSFSSTVLAIGPLLQGDTLVAGAGRSHVNIKRMIFQMNVGVRTADLLGTGDNNETWGRAAWMLALVDQDDDTSYNPDDAETLTSETVLRDGITPRIGWATVSNLVAPTTVSQTAAFFATHYERFDVKSNRRLDSDKDVTLYIVRSSLANLDNDHVDVEFAFEARLRVLYQVP